jgi:hypothetical protein
MGATTQFHRPNYPHFTQRNRAPEESKFHNWNAKLASAGWTWQLGSKKRREWNQKVTHGGILLISAGSNCHLEQQLIMVQNCLEMLEDKLQNPWSPTSLAQVLAQNCDCTSIAYIKALALPWCAHTNLHTFLDKKLNLQTKPIKCKCASCYSAMSCTTYQIGPPKTPNHSDHYSFCCNNFKQPGSQECSKWFVTIPEFCTWPTTTTTTTILLLLLLLSLRGRSPNLKHSLVNPKLIKILSFLAGWLVGFLVLPKTFVTCNKFMTLREREREREREYQDFF